MDARNPGAVYSITLPREDFEVCDGIMTAVCKYHSVCSLPFLRRSDEERPLEWWRQLFTEFKEIEDALRNQTLGAELSDADRNDNLIVAKDYRFLVWLRVRNLEENIQPHLRTRFQ